MGVFYILSNSNAQDQRNATNYLINTLDSVRTEHPDCGIALFGDFNNLDISDLLNNHNLTQLVDQPTKGSAILDLIITNMHSYYSKPTVLAPIGTSDHNALVWHSNHHHPTNHPPKATR